MLLKSLRSILLLCCALPDVFIPCNKLIQHPNMFLFLLPCRRNFLFQMHNVLQHMGCCLIHLLYLVLPHPNLRSYHILFFPLLHQLFNYLVMSNVTVDLPIVDTAIHPMGYLFFWTILTNLFVVVLVWLAVKFLNVAIQPFEKWRTAMPYFCHFADIFVRVLFGLFTVIRN